MNADDRTQSVDLAIAARYNRESEAFRRIVEILEAASAGEFNGTRLSANPAEEEKQKVLLMFLAKGSKSLWAIHELFRGGFEEDAEILLRTLIELSVIARWISEEPDERFEAWGRFEVKRRRRDIKVAEDAMPGITEWARTQLPESLEQLDEAEEAIAKQREAAKKEGIGWSEFPETMSLVLKETSYPADLRRTMYWIYDVATNLVHSNPSCKSRYWRQEGDAVHFNSGPQTPENPRILRAAVFAYIRLVESLGRLLELDISDAVGEADEIWRKTFQPLES